MEKVSLHRLLRTVLCALHMQKTGDMFDELGDNSGSCSISSNAQELVATATDRYEMTCQS